MRDLSDPDYIAKILKAWPSTWPAAKRLLLREGDYEYREGFSISIDAADNRTTAQIDDSLPADENRKPPSRDGLTIITSSGKLLFTNPDWSDEAKAALEWLSNFKRETITSFPEIAKALDMDVRQLRKYFKPGPPNPNQDTINAIWKYKNAVDP